MRVVYYPPSGESPIEFGYGTPYGLVRCSGFGDNRATGSSVRGPGQRGSTTRDIQVNERVGSVSIDVWRTDNDADAHWMDRAALQRALVTEPNEFGETPQLGRLWFYRTETLPILELMVYPRESPQYSNEGYMNVRADIEFVAPYPYPREIEDRLFNVAGSGGFTFPITHPFSMASYNVQIEVTNGGDVYAPVTVQVFGDVTDPIIYNDTTGEHIKYTGNIPSTHYLEVNTEFGSKTAELVHRTTGVRTNAMASIDHINSDFWSLRPGMNTIRFAASVNTSGYANVYWRQRYGGV